MKDNITFELVHISGYQMFYKSSVILTKGFNRLNGSMYEYNAETEQHRLREDFKHLVRKDGFEIICISNASTHYEKLAFAATQQEDGRCFRLQGQIEGVHTMMIRGGDPSACWDDEKYLRLIARHNGFSQNQVTIKINSHE